MKVSEEMNEKIEQEQKEEKVEASSGNVDYAKKWLIACGVLFLILIILIVALQFVKTGEVWPDVPLVTTSK